MKIEIIDLIAQILKRSGSDEGVTNVIYDGDTSSASISFDYDQRSFLISSESVVEFLN